MKRKLRIVGVFSLLCLPLLALCFLAYTVFHQVILVVGVLIAAWSAYYFANFVSENERLNREVFLQTYELKKANEALQACLASTTQSQVYSARLLDSKLTEECNRARRYHRPLSCLLLAIDSLSELAGQYSSVFLEALIQETTCFLRESIRSVDTVIRYGEHRLFVVLPETQLEQARVVTNRIRFAIQKKVFHVEDKTLNLTLNVGLVGFDPSAHRGKEDVVDALEKALSRAEKAGPNQTASIAGGIQ